MRRRTAIAVGIVALVAGMMALIMLPGGKTAQTASVAEAKTDDLSSLVGSANPALLKQIDASVAPPEVIPASTRVVEATPAPVAAPVAQVETPDPALPTAHVGTTAVNLRSGPNSGSATVDVLQPGEAVRVGSSQNGWVEVTLDDGATGWVYSRYIDNPGASAAIADASPVDPAAATSIAQPKPVKRPPQPARATISGDDGSSLADRTALIANTLTVYGDPGDSSSSFTLHGGQRVRIAEERGNWLRVETANGTTAWIRR